MEVRVGVRRVVVLCAAGVWVLLLLELEGLRWWCWCWCWCGRRGEDGEVRREAKGELERVEVYERGHERPRDVVRDREEEERALDRVRLPTDVKAPDILREVRTCRERLAAAERRDGHGGYHHRPLLLMLLLMLLHGVRVFAAAAAAAHEQSCCYCVPGPGRGYERGSVRVRVRV